MAQNSEGETAQNLDHVMVPYWARLTEVKTVHLKVRLTEGETAQNLDRVKVPCWARQKEVKTADPKEYLKGYQMAHLLNIDGKEIL